MLIIGLAGVGIAVFCFWFVAAAFLHPVAKLFVKDTSLIKFFQPTTFAQFDSSPIALKLILVVFAVGIGVVGSVFALGMGKAIFYQPSSSPCYSDCPDDSYGVPFGG